MSCNNFQEGTRKHNKMLNQHWKQFFWKLFLQSKFFIHILWAKISNHLFYSFIDETIYLSLMKALSKSKFFFSLFQIKYFDKTVLVWSTFWCGMADFLLEIIIWKISLKAEKQSEISNRGNVGRTVYFACVWIFH